jgi:hypothetical protein
VRRTELTIAVAAEVVSPMLVGDDEQDVWSVHIRTINHFAPHGLGPIGEMPW